MTGEPFFYSNWGTNQPNDWWGMAEDRLHYYISGNTQVRSSEWNDLCDTNPAGNPNSYVVEFEPITETPVSPRWCGVGLMPTLLFITAGFIGMRIHSRLR